MSGTSGIVGARYARLPITSYNWLRNINRMSSGFLMLWRRSQTVLTGKVKLRRAIRYSVSTGDWLNSAALTLNFRDRFILPVKIGYGPAQTSKRRLNGQSHSLRQQW